MKDTENRALTQEMYFSLLTLPMITSKQKQGDSLESDIETGVKDKEMYDLKHELISAQIKLENAEKELAKLKEENNDLQMQIVKLETEMKIAEDKIRLSVI